MDRQHLASRLYLIGKSEWIDQIAHYLIFDRLSEDKAVNRPCSRDTSYYVNPVN